MIGEFTRTDRIDQPSQPVPLHQLTKQQRRTLDVVSDYWRATHLPCPGSIIAHRLKVNRSTAMKYVSALHRKGWLRSPGAPAWLATELED